MTTLNWSKLNIKNFFNLLSYIALKMLKNKMKMTDNDCPFI